MYLINMMLFLITPTSIIYLITMMLTPTSLMLCAQRNLHLLSFLTFSKLSWWDHRSSALMIFFFALSIFLSGRFFFLSRFFSWAVFPPHMHSQVLSWSHCHASATVVKRMPMIMMIHYFRLFVNLFHYKNVGREAHKLVSTSTRAQPVSHFICFLVTKTKKNN